MSTEETPPETSDFIRSIVEDDLRSGKHQTTATRFPPEPNGYLHIGHAKAICLNFGIAERFGGTCNLRFDDTNPETEDMEYVASIQEDVRWLGFDWQDRLFHASDYFERLYELAEHLIEKGKAYVCSLSEEEIREYRGTVTEAGRPSPYRDRSVAENLDLFRRMRAGEFEDGAHVLRAKIDMAAANMKMRDPLLYRIRHAQHYRRGSDWCIYPMYDYTHCLSDSFEGITHSLCTLEFENNREIYDWVIAETDVACQPRQIEFARLVISYTVLSKRRLLQLVKDGHVDGWDDPRMPTLSGLRRRGVTPAAIRDFCDRIGVAKANSVVDVALFEHSIRDDLNHEAPRVLAVLRPLKVVITNYPEGESERLEASYWPHDVPKEGSRELTFSRELFIDRDDFLEDPPKGYRRLAPGREVRLRYGYFIRCEEVVKDETTGEVVELRCTYDPATRGGSSPDGRKVKGTIQWVSADDALDIEVRLYDRLFTVERPNAGKDVEFLDLLNPESLEVVAGAKIESSVVDAEPGSRFQFERLGYFHLDPVASRGQARVFNRIVTLRDTWARRAQPAPVVAEQKPSKSKSTVKPERPTAKRRATRRRTEKEQARWNRYRDELGLADHEAEILAEDETLAGLFEEALEHRDDARAIAAWITNDLLRELKAGTVEGIAFEGADLAALTRLQAEGVLSSKLAREVFEVMLRKGKPPEEIVRDRGLEQVSDEVELRAIIASIVEANASQADQYRGGKTALLGFFVGQVMKATRGRANPQLAKSLLEEMLQG